VPILVTPEVCSELLLMGVFVFILFCRLYSFASANTCKRRPALATSWYCGWIVIGTVRIAVCSAFWPTPHLLILTHTHSRSHLLAHSHSIAYSLRLTHAHSLIGTRTHSVSSALTHSCAYTLPRSLNTLSYALSSSQRGREHLLRGDGQHRGVVAETARKSVRVSGAL
jgi:hypothetical protein